MEKMKENATCVYERSYDVETHLSYKNLFSAKSITDWLNDWRLSSTQLNSTQMPHHRLNQNQNQHMLIRMGEIWNGEKIKLKKSRTWKNWSNPETIIHHTYTNCIRHPDTKTQTDKFTLPPPSSYSVRRTRHDEPIRPIHLAFSYTLWS